MGLPLSPLQVRALPDPEDFKGVLKDIEERLGREAALVDVDKFLGEVGALSKKLAYKGAALVPHIEHRVVPPING